MSFHCPLSLSNEYDDQRQLHVCVHTVLLYDSVERELLGGEAFRRKLAVDTSWRLFCGRSVDNLHKTG